MVVIMIGHEYKWRSVERGGVRKMEDGSTLHIYI
jgi:hypothetical protein